MILSKALTLVFMSVWTIQCLAQGGVLSGTIADQSGVPVSGAVVRAVRWVKSDVGLIKPEEYLVMTTGDGRFEIRLPAGECDLFVARSSFMPVAKECSIKEGEKKIVTIRLKFKPETRLIE